MGPQQVNELVTTADVHAENGNVSNITVKIVLIDGLSNKHRRCKKPWWNDDLTSLWNEVCSAEKIWIKCQNSHLKKELRHKYVQKRKIFDRNVKKAKPICVVAD
jgi:hypothetical protein